MAMVLISLNVCLMAVFGILKFVSRSFIEGVWVHGPFANIRELICHDLDVIFCCVLLGMFVGILQDLYLVFLKDQVIRLFENRMM